MDLLLYRICQLRHSILYGYPVLQTDQGNYFTELKSDSRYSLARKELLRNLLYIQLLTSDGREKRGIVCLLPVFSTLKGFLVFKYFKLLWRDWEAIEKCQLSRISCLPMTT